MELAFICPNPVDPEDPMPVDVAEYFPESVRQTQRAAESLKAAAMLLRSLIQIPSVSGNEDRLTRFVADWAISLGLEVDLWQADEAELASRYDVPPRHLPLAGRPTLVLKLPGNKSGRSVIFNAHADVVSAPNPEKWERDPWAGDMIDGRVIGRGACDVKGPLAAGMMMVMALKADHPDGLDGDVLLEVIPGEEDCVGFGTLTSVARGHVADACIVLEPTDSSPRAASRGGARFEIVCLGKAVHGTVKWLGKDAIALSRKVMNALDELEHRWNDRSADSLFASAPIARPISIDSIQGGEWQGMTCDRCLISGYLELLPADDLEFWKTQFKAELAAVAGPDVSVSFTESYRGHRTSVDSGVCTIAEQVVRDRLPLHWTGWQAFNSGCEAGLRASLLSTPTLVWGPGSLADAHAVNESIAIADVVSAARMFEQFALAWSGSNSCR